MKADPLDTSCFTRPFTVTVAEGKYSTDDKPRAGVCAVRKARRAGTEVTYESDEERARIEFNKSHSQLTEAAAAQK